MFAQKTISRKKVTFNLVKTAEITVPKNYDPDSYAQSFISENDSNPEIEFFQDTSLLNGRTFKKTLKLKPGTTYIAEIYESKEWTSYEEGLDFATKTGNLLVGFQGLALFWTQQRKELPEEWALISYDMRNRMPKMDESVFISSLWATSYWSNHRRTFAVQTVDFKQHGNVGGFVHILTFREKKM